MIDIKFLRENPEIVKENIKKKFQEHKLDFVDEVIAWDAKNREYLQEVEQLRANKNKTSKLIGQLMGQGKKEEAEEVKAQIAKDNARIDELDVLQKEAEEEVKKRMMVIPNIIDPSVPIGKDDSENVEVERFGEPVTPDFEVPYHTEIMEKLHGIDMDSAGRVAGNGFYYLTGDIARLHSAVISYARDFMIDRGFTYCVPPYMIRSSVVTGVMSFEEMDAMMYKIEGEDLYLIGTSEHSMIGRYIDQIIPEEELPLTLTSYSPCFRKEKGAHGIEERGVYNAGVPVVLHEKERAVGADGVEFTARDELALLHGVGRGAEGDDELILRRGEKPAQHIENLGVAAGFHHVQPRVERGIGRKVDVAVHERGDQHFIAEVDLLGFFVEAELPRMQVAHIDDAPLVLDKGVRDRVPAVHREDRAAINLHSAASCSARSFALSSSKQWLRKSRSRSSCSGARPLPPPSMSTTRQALS